MWAFYVLFLCFVSCLYVCTPSFELPCIMYIYYFIVKGASDKSPNIFNAYNCILVTTAIEIMFQTIFDKICQLAVKLTKKNIINNKVENKIKK